MKVGILVTNNGPHSAEKWAEQTAAQIVDIIQVEPNSLAYDELTAQKIQLEAELVEALADHHGIIQQDERDAIDQQGLARLDDPIEPEDQHVDDAVAKVTTIAKTKMFGSHFNKPEVINFIRDTIGSHFASVMHIERSWHADRNADTPEAQAFRTKYHPGLGE